MNLLVTVQNKNGRQICRAEIHTDPSYKDADEAKMSSLSIYTTWHILRKRCVKREVLHIDYLNQTLIYSKWPWFQSLRMFSSSFLHQIVYIIAYKFACCTTRSPRSLRLQLSSVLQKFVIDVYDQEEEKVIGRITRKIIGDRLEF